MKGRDRNGLHLGLYVMSSGKLRRGMLDAGCWSKIDLTIDAI